MIRRLLLVAAAAVALMLAPTTAMAFNAPMVYNAPGFNCTVSDTTPGVGVPFTVACTGADANSAVTLAITGQASITKTADASGGVTFTATLNKAGTFTLTVTNAAGAVLSDQTVTVVAAAAAAVPQTLARTGIDVLPWAAGGGLLVLAGAGAVLVARRRKSSQTAA